MATAQIANTTDQMLAGFLPSIKKGLGMAVYDANRVFKKVLGAGQKKKWTGESVQVAMVTSTYGKAASYSGDDTVDTTPVDNISAAQFELAGYQNSINLTGMDIRKSKNSPNRLFDLLKTQTRMAMVDMMDVMSTHLFQTSNDTKGILSLYTVTDATTTIAGKTAGSDWGGTTTTSGSFASQGKNDLLTLRQTLSNYASLEREAGGDKPDLNVTTDTIYRYYWQSLEPSMRYTPGGKGDVNLEITFWGVPVVTDSHVPSGCWFMLNTKALELHVMPGADFEILAPTRETAQPDVWGRGIIWNGQLVFNARHLQGKLTSISA